MMSKFTDAEKADCAKRELQYRMRVYTRRVADGHMTEKQAKRELALMQEIHEDYRVKSELPL